MPKHPGHFEVVRLFSAEKMAELVRQIVPRFPNQKFWLKHNPQFMGSANAKILMVTMPPDTDPSAILGFAEGVLTGLKAQKEKPASLLDAGRGEEKPG